MTPIGLLTRNEVQRLRKKRYSNGKSISITEREVKAMQMQLEKLFGGRVNLSFAEKIVFLNKAY